MRYWLVVFVLLASAFAVAQDGVSTAGAARSKYLGELGILPSSREVVVEDFVNYHRHEIGRPKAGEAVALDVRWGGEQVGTNMPAILQVGLSTALAHDDAELPPINLVLVIDKSGSMAASDKLTRVKAALCELVARLRPEDILSIVVFDSEASVLLPAQHVTDRAAIERLITSVEPGSSTNLNGGLMLGYAEAMKHLIKGGTNRVVLLTDGIANQGVTEPAEIEKASRSFNQQGVDLSTIGVGLDLNKDLLIDLAKSGRGLFHFVSDTEDIQKVFVNELQSLLSPVATEPNLEITYGPGLELEQVYGYEPRPGQNTVNIKLANMNSGMTEVVMLKLKAVPTEADDAKRQVTVRLTYFDLERKKAVEVRGSATVVMVPGRGDGPLKDHSVAKDFAIAQLAQSIHTMAERCEVNDFASAQGELDRSISWTHKNFPSSQDPDINRTLSIAEKYQQVLRKRSGAPAEDMPVPTSENLVANGDFSQGNTGFNSGLGYVAPAYNCLWPAAYTVAPTWNHPLLHRLFASAPYEAPIRKTGREQVLFANAGEPGELVMWSTVVKCQPNTTYHITFQAISLNSQKDWVPDYEIRVDGDRSMPQPAGFGKYDEISMYWNSKNRTSATLSIVRMPILRGGLVGIANISMAPVKLRPPRS